MLNEFKRVVFNELLLCTVSPFLGDLRQITLHTDWLICSGGDQIELRSIFSQRKISNYFNAGIFGSPSTKAEILSSLLQTSAFEPSTTLFIGDSKLDHQVSSSFNIDFLFLSGWTDMRDWQKYCHDHSLLILATYHSYCCLLSLNQLCSLNFIHVIK